MKTAKKTKKLVTSATSQAQKKAHSHFQLTESHPRERAFAEVFALGFLMFAGVLVVFSMMISHY